MSTNYELKLKKVSFITSEGNELSREQISEEQFQAFCNEFESSRIENKVIWPEVDERYKKHSQNAKKAHKVNIEKIVFLPPESI